MKRTLIGCMLVATLIAGGIGFIEGYAQAGGLNTYDGLTYVNLYAGGTNTIETGAAITNPAADGIQCNLYKGQATLVYLQQNAQPEGTNHVAVWESATTNGTYTLVASNELVGLTATMTTEKLDMQGRSKYLRVRVTQSGTSNGQASVVLVTY